MTHHYGAWILIAALALTACAPATPAPPSGAPQTGQGGARPAEPPGRTLVAAVRVEPATIASRPLQEARGVATYLSGRMFNASLALLDARGAPLPYLAETLPQLNSDSWRVAPDGSMETTYRLRANLSWHDGTPLSAEDFVFAWQVYAHPELGSARRLPMAAIAEVSAPDDRTIRIRWSRPYPDADTLTDRQAELPPLPRHILQRSLEEDSPEAFTNHPYWTREFVGLGPYKLQRWDVGTAIEAVAFDGHVLGRPKIDRIRIIFISDSNAALATMLAGDAHLAADAALRLEHALILKNQWGPMQGGDVLLHSNQWRAVHFQHRPELVSPRSLLDTRVRKALAHAVDRQSINEAVYGGVLEHADSMVSPKSDWGEAAQRAAAKYPFDLRRSEAIMAEAGYARSDGIFASPGVGRFQAQVKTNSASDNESEMSILAATWRQAGFDVQDAVLPAAQAQDNEVRSTFPGMYANNVSMGVAAMLNLTSLRIPSPANRWNGGNRGGWSDPEYDRLAEAFSTTLDRNERAQQVAQMVRIHTEDVGSISLLYRAHPWVFVSTLKGLDQVVPPESFMAWKIHEWTFE
jgi:peptide/nickel transport system substrate-binding protein